MSHNRMAALAMAEKNAWSGAESGSLMMAVSQRRLNPHAPSS